MKHWSIDFAKTYPMTAYSKGGYIASSEPIYKSSPPSMISYDSRIIRPPYTAPRDSWFGNPASGIPPYLFAYLLELLGGSVVITPNELENIRRSTRDLEVLQDDHGNTIYRVGDRP